jgi:hypothetical protein
LIIESIVPFDTVTTNGDKPPVIVTIIGLLPVFPTKQKVPFPEITAAVGPELNVDPFMIKSLSAAVALVPILKVPVVAGVLAVFAAAPYPYNLKVTVPDILVKLGVAIVFKTDAVVIGIVPKSAA